MIALQKKYNQNELSHSMIKALSVYHAETLVNSRLQEGENGKEEVDDGNRTNTQTHTNTE